MIRKRVAKISNQRNPRQNCGTTESDTTTPSNDQHIINELINERQSIIPPLSRKPSTIDFIGLYSPSYNDPDTTKLRENQQDISSDNETIKYQPKEKRNIKQNATFSTSDLKKRKRHINEIQTPQNATQITPVHEIQEEDTPPKTDIVSFTNIETDIPDDITIQAIKMKRKKIREGNFQDNNDSNTTDDFIPLEYMPDKPGLGFSNSDKLSLIMKNVDMILHKNEDSKSRLIREDDEIEDNIDEIINRDEEVFESWKQSKIMFGKPKDDRNKGDQRESFGDIEMDDIEPAEDEEKNREISDFETKQMRNAGLYLPENTKRIHTQNNLFKSSEEIENEEMLKIEQSRMLEESVNRFDLKKNSKLIESFEIVENQLLERMKELEISHSSCLKVVLDTNNDLEHSAKMLSQLNEDIDQYKEQYEYFQEMGRFIYNMSDLLDLKLPEIEILESQIMDIQERYYRQIFEKSFHGHVSFMPSYREDQYERVASFGGDGTVEITHNRFVQEVTELVEKMKVIFSDVDEEYCSLSSLKARFEGWKGKYPSLYRDTYCSLCLHKMFSIFLRHELFTTGSPISLREKETLPSWSISPLLCTSFSVFEFWKLLFNYGENMSEEEETILPDIVRKTTLPFILHTLSKVYNPMDINQTRSAIELVKEYKVYLDSNSDTNEDAKIMETLVERLCETVHNFKFPSIVQDINLVDEYVKQSISIISESVVPWLEIYPPLNSSDRLAHQTVNQLINTKLVTFVDYCVSKDLISKKEKIKFLMLVGKCKLPIHWKSELHLSIN